MEPLYGQLTEYKSLSSELDRLIVEHKLPLVAGGSPKGWSRAATFEACPRAYYYRFIKELEAERPARDVGNALHAFLALYYTGQMAVDAPKNNCVDARWLRDALLQTDVNPESIEEAWRLFDAYIGFYREDFIKPVAAEYTAVDVRLGHSCRYDLIAQIEDAPPSLNLQPGYYIVEHKSAKFFSAETLDGWELDGEIIGQILLWERARLWRKFGPLKGVIVNIIGKQKQPQFHRTIVAPQAALGKAHLKVLNHLDERIEECKRKRFWPQYFNACIGRYSRCDYYDTCRYEQR